MKKILEGTPYFDLYYTRKFPKPFTFAVYLPIKTIEGNKILLKTEPNKEVFITWNISFTDTKLSVTFVSELLKKRAHNWRNEIEFSLIDIKSLEEKFPEGATKVVFKTLSPIHLKDKDGKAIEPTRPDFEEEFNKVQKRIFETLGFPYGWISVKPKKCNKEKNFFCIKKRVVKLKLEGYRRETQKELLKIPAFEGIFEVEGKPEVLKLLYQKGLGQRTAEGFGMIEIL
jgi:CRISPR-associated endoribonuclease Cas6